MRVKARLPSEPRGGSSDHRACGVDWPPVELDGVQEGERARALTESRRRPLEVPLSSPRAEGRVPVVMTAATERARTRS